MNLTTALTPLEIIYKGLLRLHQKYQLSQGTEKSPIPSIGVGNLRIGGTGKTPLTIFLAKRLVRRYRTGVIHSGYKRKSKGYVYVKPHAEIDVESVGDEPFLIFQKLSKEIYLFVDKNRVRTLEYALRQGIEAIVLDDNFQYLRVKPHAQIVIILPEDLDERLLPAGRLREPLESIKRADIILLNLKHKDHFEFQNSWDKPVFIMRYKIQGFKNPKSGESILLHDLKASPVLVFCGIADPESFLNSLKKVGLNVAFFKRYIDHIWFKKKHIDTILSLKKKYNAKFIITTEKDLVRLPFIPEDLLVPEFDIQIEGETKFFELLREFSGLEFKKGSNG